MKKYNSITDFAHCMDKQAKTIADRAMGFLYFYAITKNTGASLKQIISDFEAARLGKPNITKLRAIIAADKRTSKISKDAWILKADKISQTEKSFRLDRCLRATTRITVVNGDYVDEKRITNLRKKKGAFDFSRLIQMLIELDHAFEVENYISVILLIRAILDHIPPIFGFSTFNEVANNYKSTTSFKESVSNLENSSRKISDSYLHTKIRKKESLPSKTQVNFSHDLDVLLAEIIRIST